MMLVAPLIGEPTLLAVSPIVLAQCPCPAKSIMLLCGVNAITGCQSCGRAWALQGATSGPDGQQATLVPVLGKGGN